MEKIFSNPVDQLEYEIYETRQDFFTRQVLNVDEYCNKISPLRKAYFELTGKEYIPCLIKD